MNLHVHTEYAQASLAIPVEGVAAIIEWFMLWGKHECLDKAWTRLKLDMLTDCSQFRKQLMAISEEETRAIVAHQKRKTEGTDELTA